MVVMENSRYERTYNIKNFNDGITYLSNRYRINVQEREDDIFHQIQKRDSLDSIAFLYYGDETLYWIIQDYNDIPFGLELILGDVLRLPSYETVIQEILGEE